MTTYRYFDSEGLNLDPNYKPHALLDMLLERFNLKNDAALSRKLEVTPPVISKLRHHRNPVTAALLLRMHAASGLPVDDLRVMMGDQITKP